MRFISDFSPVIRILVWIMFAVSLGVAVFCALIVCGVALPVNFSPAQAAPLLFATTVVGVFSAMVGTVHYKITDTHLRLNLAFFDIFCGRVRLENILNIVIKKDEKGVRNMYISYIAEGYDPIISRIAVHEKHFERFKTELTAKNPKIVFFEEKD